MPNNKYLKVKDIKLDLKNYRTIPQNTEIDAINAMIAIKPDRFYAVVESILDDGYLPTENLIILDDKGYTVKEGNRRTAALKLILGLHSIDDFTIPDSLKTRINSIDSAWKKENEAVPCNVYSLSEKDKVDKIVNLTHAKGEKASRDPWTSVAKARQNRDEKNASEPTLDLLEKYIQHGKNITNQQKERWSGDYPYTVLEEALRRIFPRLGYNSVKELVQAYPKMKQSSDIENMLRDIGLEVFGFNAMRDKNTDFAASYNIPVPVSTSSNPSQVSSSSQNTNLTSSSTSTNNSNTQQNNNSSSNSGPATNSQQQTTPSSSGSSPKPKAYAIHDQRTVTQTLKKFNPLR